MPPKARWLTEIPAILEQLEQLSTPVVDRRTCEKLFRVRRRRAAELMHSFGGYRSGNTVLLDRATLIGTLKAALSAPEFRYECKRKQRLSRSLNELERNARARSVKLPVHSDAAHSCRLQDLPTNIRFEAGRLVVMFATADELFAHLFLLAQAAANDFEQIRRVLERSGQTQTNP